MWRSMLGRLRLPFMHTRKRSGATPQPPAKVLSAARPRRLRRLRNVAIGCIAAVGLFAVVGFFLVPPIAKHYLVKSLSEQLGRQVTISEIDVNPFAMTAKVKGFSVAERNGSAVFAAFEELLLNLEYRSILRRAPVLSQLRLTNLYLHLIRNADGKTYNFSDLVDKFSQPSTGQSDSPARFSLNNIELVNGRIELEDKPKASRHTMSEIQVAIPFISNLPDVVETYVQPSFSARVNGTPIALKGRTKPFKDTLETSVDLDVKRLDIARYMEYVPVKLGFRLASGFLDTRLTASFVRAPGKAPLVLVAGEIGVEKLTLADLDGKPLLSLAALTVPVTALDVLARKAQLGNVALTSPEVFVRRARDGSLNWATLFPRQEPVAASEEKPGNGQGFALTLAEAAIHDGEVHVEDLVPAEPFRNDLSGIQATLRRLTLPQTAPAEAELSFRTKLEESVKAVATVSIDPVASEGSVEVRNVRLKSYAPYYSHLVLYRVEDGAADLSTRYSFQMNGHDTRTRLTEFNLDLRSIRMRKPGSNEDFLRAKTASIANADVDVDKLVLSVGQFTTRDGVLDIIREPDGALNATRILPAPKDASTAQRQGTPWQITLAKADVEKWRIGFSDLSVKQPVRVIADDVRIKASGISNQANRRGQISLQAKLNDTGALKVSGPVMLNPLSAELDLQLDRFGLVPLQPYFSDKVNILVTSADASLKGRAKLAIARDGAVNAAYNGDLSLTDFASVDKTKSEDLLKWRSLFIGGVAYTHAPTALSVDEVALSDFYARIILSPEGRLNLQDIRAAENGHTEGGEAAGPSTHNGAPPAAVPQAQGRGAPQPGAAPPSAPPKAPATAGPPAAPAAPTSSVRIAKVTLQGGNVNFTDLFIKPNYSADLSEIGGSVIGLSSQLDTAADVDLRGKFAKSAPVDIKGKVNPLVQNLYLDLKASVRDIELGPFTPYSGKYVGYAIEKGKMAFDVAYKVENRKLAASNKLVLNQLTFGDKVESPQATKLPVLLAVALLKDRNGVIDINLPISGSLDDPKFSVGGIIWQVVLNLIEKAVTAPFALIGNLLGGGGGEELAYIEFDYGSAVMSQAAQDKLSKLQTALVERPGLKLDITGRADPERDRAGLRRLRFEQQVKAQKLKETVKGGAATRSVDEVQIDPAEYEKYLKRAYKEAKFAKPRNAIGITKDLPREEMEKLMLANIQVSDDDLAQLANQRSQAAKAGITQGEKVPVERVFLLAPKVEAKPDDKLKPSRVDFSIK